MISEEDFWQTEQEILMTKEKYQNLLIFYVLSHLNLLKLLAKAVPKCNSRATYNQNSVSIDH